MNRMIVWKPTEPLIVYTIAAELWHEMAKRVCVLSVGGAHTLVGAVQSRSANLIIRRLLNTFIECVSQ